MAGTSKSSSFWSLVRNVGTKPDDQSRNLFQRDPHGHNRGLVITVCMLTAFGLWVLLSLDDPGEIRLELQATVTNQPEDKAFAEIPVTSVMASVRGDVLTLAKLKFRPPPFLIDASLDMVESQTAVDWPQGVTAEFDSPQIALYQETRIQRSVPVASRVTIRTATAYSLFEAPVLAPDSVTISGAANIVGSVAAWPTETIRRVGIKDSLVFAVPLLDSLAGLVALSDERVTLSAQAHRFTEGIRELRVTVSDIPNSQNAVDLDPPLVAVRFHAPLSQYDAVQHAEDFFAVVSYETIRLDTSGFVAPQIMLPAGLLVRHIGTQPSSLNYYVNTGLQ